MDTNQVFNRLRFIKPQGWGLPGGKIDFHVSNPLNNPPITSITVKLIFLNEKDEILFGLERPLPEKIKKRYYNYLDFRREIKKTLRFFKSRGYNTISRTEINSLFANLLGTNWNTSNIKTKILLTAVKESLEETGLLIRPKILTRIKLAENHEVVICLATIIKGKQFQKSFEIAEFKWLSLKNLLDWKMMYLRHKFIFLPAALKILLKENYPFANKKEVENFLEKIEESQKTPVA